MINFYVLGVIDPVTEHKIYLNRYHHYAFETGAKVRNEEKDKLVLFDEWYFDDNKSVLIFNSEYEAKEFLSNTDMYIPRKDDLMIFEIEGDPHEWIPNWKILYCNYIGRKI